MRIWLNKYFGFSKGEFNGLLLLILIIVVLKAIPFIYGYIRPVEKDDPGFLAKMQKITVADEKYASNLRDRIENSYPEKTTKLFNFDPNTLNAEGWQTLGLSPKQAKAIVNYTGKGGKFYKPEDLQKMYTISPEMYKKILPYVKIANQNVNASKKYLPFEKKEYVKKAPVIIDINQADSAQLDEIKGIGAAFAKRILKYRERLGGFLQKRTAHGSLWFRFS
ncbi:helix-hairpin-helix domain-containing protein [Pedobacter miscanthi]|uniref:ComEA family DNA-binding protein n=1 Tax=Pedobacter miscanthi TaxID=2259170 RepID=UPI00292DB33B|nr:helix-hairpin-helix domain-containing protein [Pedobacter miscanthi]